MANQEHHATGSAAGLAVKLAAAVVMMLVLVAGIFAWGRLAADDRAAMLLTGAWFAVVFVAAFLLTRRRTGLRLPLAVGYVIVVGAATVVLGLPMLGDDEVDEQVVTAASAGTSAAAPSRASAPSTSAAEKPSGNVAVASGSFRAIAHPGSGTASVIELPDGERMLTLTKFATDNGPDLRVYLASADPAQGGELGDSKDLGALKGNKGDQQYVIPKDVDVSRLSTVVVWCRAFSVGFTSAKLDAS